MTSQVTIPVIGLTLTVYGLEEYNKLPQGTPVSVMFALHGRLQNQTKMQPIAQALCKLNDNRKKGNRHLIVVTFDAPNHGSRLLHKQANYAWVEGKHQNPNHALDMWTMVNSVARTVTELIDVLEHYIFGPQSRSVVEVWGCMGFSMGGHSTFLAAANDPRITVAIPIVGIADFLALMDARLREGELSADSHLPKPFYDTVRAATCDLDQKLKSKHILIINGGKDKLVRAEFNKPLIDSLRKIHDGKEGYDWRFYLVPGVGHAWCPEMFESSVQWCDQWMVKSNNTQAAKL